MYLCKNSRYVLQKVQRLAPSSNILAPLLGSDRRLSSKYPNDDPSKPPLRVNIPKDSNSENHSRLIRDDYVSEPRSRSVISTTHDSAKFEGPFVSKSESELQVPDFEDAEEYHPRKETFQNVSKYSSPDVSGRAQRMTSYVSAQKDYNRDYNREYSRDYSRDYGRDYRESSYAETSDAAAQDGLVNDASAGYVDQSKQSFAGTEDTKKQEMLSEYEKDDDTKTLYIIIDVPEKQDEKSAGMANRDDKLHPSIFFDEDSVRKFPSKAQSGKKSKLKVNVDKNDTAASQKGKSKSSTKLDAKAKKSRMNVQVQEIEDSSAYVFRVRFKKNFQNKCSTVGCVPETDVKARAPGPDNYVSAVAPVSGSSGKGAGKPGRDVIVADDHPELIRYPENMYTKPTPSKTQMLDHGKRSGKWMSQSTSQASGPFADDVNSQPAPAPAAELVQESETVTRPPEPSPFVNFSQTPSYATYPSEPAASRQEHAADSSAAQGEHRPSAASETKEVQSTLSEPLYYQYSSVCVDQQSVPNHMRHSDVFSSTSTQHVPRPEKRIDKKRSFKGDKKFKKSVKFSESCPEVKAVKAAGAPRDDIIDFQKSASVVNIACDNLSSNPTRYCAAFPPILSEALKGRGKNFGFKREGLFNEKWINKIDFRPKDFEMNPKCTQVSGYSENSILFPKKDTEKFLIRGKDDILHVVKRKQEEAPKISDNMVNVANEDLTEDKGTASVDSLTMMKKVKEIIDFDLKNAIKIFDGRTPPGGKISSVVVLQGNEWGVNAEELKDCVRAQESETHVQISYAHSSDGRWTDKMGEVSSLPKYLPPKDVRESVVKLEAGPLSSDSVVMYNPGKNEFRVGLTDLENLISRRREETFGGLGKVNDEPYVVGMEMKSGDSILVFDEATQTWKVDYSILEKREERLREEEELAKRSEFILETIEELERGRMKRIPNPTSRDKRVFDYGKEEWKIYKSKTPTSGVREKATKSKYPFKESDAEEIRKQNSDLYDNLFMTNKKEAQVNKNGNNVPTSLQSKAASDSTTTNTPSTPETPATPATPTSSDPPTAQPEIQKNPTESTPEKVETPRPPSRGTEDNFWGSFLRMDILPRTVDQIPKVKVPPAPPPPVPPAVPPTTQQPPKVELPKDKTPKGRVEQPKFKITIPFVDKKKDEAKKPPPASKVKQQELPKVKPTPAPSPKEKMEKVKIKIPQIPHVSILPKEEPKVKTPSPGKEEPKLKTPPSPKEEPKLKTPLSPATPPSEKPKEAKEEPKVKAPPVPAQPKEDPRANKPPPTIGAPKASAGTKLAENPEPKFTDDPASSPSSGSKDKTAADHYISKNIVEITRNKNKDLNSKVKTNKIETVKVNITTDKRMPSKITEINLNRKCEEKAKESGAKKQNAGDSKKPMEGTPKKEKVSTESKTFYKNFEKYKTPFSDPEYEEKSIKINSDVASNPNLKKLDNWNKTLVLHDIGKPSENIESWLKDETDKMATLLLKVLQDAADGKPRRKPPSGKSKSCEKLGSGNPYDNIRKKQETTPENFLFRVRTVNIALENDKKPKTTNDLNPGHKSEQSFKDIPVQSAKTVKPEKVVEAVKVTPSPEKPAKAMSEIDLKTLKADKQTALETPQTGAVVKPTDPEIVPHSRLELTEEIPGPEFLKKLSGAWRMFPAIGCQMTVATLFRIFQLVSLGSIFDSSNPDKSRRRAFEKLFNKYGPIVNVQGPLSGNVILIHKPHHLHAVFDQDITVPVRSVFDSLEQSRREAEDKLQITGIATDWSRPEWNELKKASGDPLMRGCEKYYGMLEVAAETLVNTILRNRNGQNFVSEDFMEEIKRWSLEGLCNVLFEKSFGFLEGRSTSPNWVLEPDKLYMAVDEATEYLTKCEKGFQTWRLMATPSSAGLGQAYRSLSGILAKQLYQAELNLKNKNELLKEVGVLAPRELTFLESMLLNDGMTTDEVTCNLIDILLIGSNTLNSALGFLLYHLSQNVKAQNRLLKELKEALPEKTSRLDYHKLHSLKYLQACLKESLRLNMPFPIFFRLLQNDILVSNYIVPKGTHIIMDLRVSCMKEQIYDEPKKFIPERWLTEENWMHDVHPFSVFPFCHGPRAELAKRVVEMQLWACAAKIIRNFEVEYHFGEIYGTNNVVSLPDKPLKLNFIERQR